MEKVAIIGMGTSGMAVLSSYAKVIGDGKRDVEILCFDEDYSFGKGYPYREDSDELILNLKIKKLSYDYENVEDFFAWLTENGIESKEYAPRRVFGEYNTSRMERDIKRMDAQVIKDRVEDITKDKDTWQIRTASGDVHTVDRIHLCNGVLPQKDHYGLSEKEGYINSIYPVNEKLKDISPDKKVLIIGNGLTSVDVASYLINVRGVRNILMTSRTAVYPTVRVEPTVNPLNVFTMEKLNEVLEKNHNMITFEEFDGLMLEELKSHGVDFDEFNSVHMIGTIEGVRNNLKYPDKLSIVQDLLPKMNLIFNKTWDNMGKEDRKRMKAKWHPFLTLNRSPLPLISAELLMKAEDNGILTVRKNLEDIVHENGRFIPVIEGKREGEYDVVINATGIDLSMKDIGEVNPLIERMMDRRYLMADEAGGLCVVPETMCAISPRYGTLENCHCHGVLVSGVQYRNNSTLIIQNTAHRVAKNLLGR